MFVYWPCLTTGLAARLWQVSTHALKRWMCCRQGMACKTPGGNRRIGLEEMQPFLWQYGMPPAPIPAPNICTLIICDCPVMVHFLVGILAAGPWGDHLDTTRGDAERTA
jgi:hypothetical protein